MSDKIELNFFLTVWGGHHTELCISACLPSLMSHNNIPAILDYKKQHTLWIFATESSISIIESSAVYASISDAVNIKINVIPESEISCPTITVNTCYRHVVKNINQYSRLVWLAPDIVWADGTFKNLYNIAKTGKKTVVCPYFRASEENFIRALQSYNLDSAITIIPRDLVRIGLENIHPISQSLFFECETFNSWPCQIFWRISPLGIIAKYFHAFPLMTTPDLNILPDIDSSEAIDGGSYLEKLIDDRNEIYIVQDSDIMFCCEAVPDSYTVHPITHQQLQTIDVADWATSNANELQRYFFDHPVLIHADDLSCHYHAKLEEIHNFSQLLCTYIEDISRLNSGNYASLLSNDGLVGVAASVLLGCFDNASTKLLVESKSLFARFYIAVYFWLNGDDENAIRFLTGINSEYAHNLIALISKPRLEVLTQLDKGSWSCIFDALSHDSKFKLTNIGYKQGDFPHNLTASIHGYYSADTPPDFYVTKMLEWHHVPFDIQELPCPTFAQSADYDIHIQSVFPWLHMFDELIVEHEWDDVTKLVDIPVTTYPKAYPLLTAASLAQYPSGQRDIDVLISGTTFHPYHPDKSALLNRILEIEGLNVCIIDGFLDTLQYLDLLARAKICITYIRRPGMPTRGLEALSMGCAVLAQEQSSLLLYVKENEGVFAYNNNNVEQKIRTILNNWESLQAPIARSADFIRSEFNTVKVASQYFRFLTFLAAKPRKARKMHSREELTCKRLIMLKGWSLHPEINRSIRRMAQAQLAGSYTSNSLEAKFFINATREMVMEYASAANNQFSCELYKRYGKDNDVEDSLLAEAFWCFEDGIRRFPESLILSFNYIRAALSFGGAQEVKKALILGRETVARNRETWRVALMDDVFSWDYFSCLFNYRAYFDEIMEHLKGNVHDQAKLVTLVIASIHYHLSYYTDELSHAKNACVLDDVFPFYKLRYARLLACSEESHCQKQSADMLYDLAMTSMLTQEACNSLEALAQSNSYACKIYAELCEKHRKLEKCIIKISDDDYSLIPLQYMPVSPLQSLPPLHKVACTNYKILYISLEFSRWDSAKSWAYPANMGFEEGFEASGISYVTVPALCEYAPESPVSWLSYLKSICENKQFEQVWLEVVHNNLDESVLSYLATLAPIRLALIGESLTYPEEVYALQPHLRQRQAQVAHRLHYMTHALAADELDVYWLNSQKIVKALWWVQAIPSRVINQSPPPVSQSYALFSGVLYGERERWLQEPELSGLLLQQRPLELDAGLPELFDGTNSQVVAALSNSNSFSAELLDQHNSMLRAIRRQSFDLWLQGLTHGSSVVNLPSFFHGYAGRVYEGMAVGRPVITWEIPDRPMTRSLFEDGREILMYSKDDPSQLASHIRRVVSEPEYAEEIAHNALRVVKCNHTIELRVRQIMTWLDCGEMPSYRNESEVVANAQAQRGKFNMSNGNIDVADMILEAKQLIELGRAEESLTLYKQISLKRPNDRTIWKDYLNLAILLERKDDLLTAKLAINRIENDLRMNQNATRPDFMKHTINIHSIADRMQLFIPLCSGKKVLHVGCTDYPIFNPMNNLHIQLNSMCSQLDGLDVDREGIAVLSQYVKGNYYTSPDDVTEYYDVLLVPETIEHVDNIGGFLKELSKLQFGKCLITAPNAFLPQDNGNYWENETTYVENVHPDHKYWFSPYTLSNSIQACTDWNVRQVYMLNNYSIVACLCEKK